MNDLAGWVVVNGNLGDRPLIHADSFKNSAEKLGIEMSIMRNSHLLSHIQDGESKILGVEPQQLPNFIIFWDKDRYLARQLESFGVRLFNRAEVIESCDDKCIMYQKLSNHGLRIPHTIFAPKVFPWDGTRDFQQYDVIAETLGFPLIIKEAYGSYGSQVYLIRDYNMFIEKIAALEGTAFLFQEFIPSSFGTDVRVQIVGGEAVASMRRVSNGDFRSNIGQGAMFYPHKLTLEQEDVAVKCASLLDVDFAGVDLLFGADGEPIVCEINSNAHVLNLSKCSGVNVPDCMLTYIRDEMG